MGNPSQCADVLALGEDLGEREGNKSLYPNDHMRRKLKTKLWHLPLSGLFYGALLSFMKMVINLITSQSPHLLIPPH